MVPGCRAAAASPRLGLGQDPAGNGLVHGRYERVHSCRQHLASGCYVFLHYFLLDLAVFSMLHDGAGRPSSMQESSQLNKTAASSEAQKCSGAKL